MYPSFRWLQNGANVPEPIRRHILRTRLLFLSKKLPELPDRWMKAPAGNLQIPILISQKMEAPKRRRVNGATIPRPFSRGSFTHAGLRQNE